MQRYGYLVTGAMVVAVADLLTKSWAQSFLISPIRVLPFLQLTLAKNTGLAFGVSAPNLLTVLASILAVVYLVYLYAKKTHAERVLTIVSFALIIGGAFGNLYERIVQGSVTDFIALFSIPYFNLADTALTFGVIILLFFHARIFTKPL